MKNSKLLLTSALVGTVAMSSAAFSETKISGGATFTYSALNGTSTAGNDQGAGKEVQIDISNSATLENGVGFSAGFSLEQDGGQSSFDGNEGNFMKFTSGNTSFMYNIDKAANLSTSATPRASTSINTMLAGINGTSAATSAIYDYSPGSQAQQSAWNVEIAQKLEGMGTAYLVYVPKQGDAGGANDGLDTSKTGTSMDVIFKGNAGVDGLNVLVGYSNAESSDTSLQDVKVQQLGIGYNFGKFAVGVTRAKTDQADNTEDTQLEYGITYAVSDNLTVGLLHANTDTSDTADNEKINSLQVGYNLGALSVEAYAVEIQNWQGSSANSGREKMGLRLGTKF
jgi:hypothetical protein